MEAPHRGHGRGGAGGGPRRWRHRVGAGAGTSCDRPRALRRLYVRIYLTVLASLALSALLIGLAVRLTVDERPGQEAVVLVATMVAELLPPQAPLATQRDTLQRWALRARAQLGLFDAAGGVIERTDPSLEAPAAGRGAGGWHHGSYALRLPDGRWLVAARAWQPSLTQGTARLLGTLALIALAVAVAAWPLVRRLTRGLERLQASVEAFGRGELAARAPVRGDDEVARLAASFNAAADRIAALVRAQKSLLANASHELRSPLARIRMAIETAEQPGARAEAVRSVGELDALVDEILLTSRLDAADAAPYPFEPVDLTGLVAEACAEAGADLDATPASVDGHPALLRRLVRNLLDNARRHAAGAAAEVRVRAEGEEVVLQVADRGPGIPAALRERVFEPFYRLPGAAEREGGVGLGLALVRQIAQRHGGQVRCDARAGGGAVFELRLPRAAEPPVAMPGP